MNKQLLLIIAKFFSLFLGCFFNIKSVQIFGSFLHKQRPNDIDLVIDGCDENSFMAKLIKKIACYCGVDINYLVNNKINYINKDKYYQFVPIGLKNISQLN